jgi:hypothetical protein
MKAIGIPLARDRWWEHCTDENGDPVHILTLEDVGRIQIPILEPLAARLSEKLKQTINEVFAGRK